MQKVQRTSTQELKRKAVRLAQTSGKPIAHVARELAFPAALSILSACQWESTHSCPKRGTDQDVTASCLNEKCTGDARPYGAFCSVLVRTAGREVPYGRRANRRGKPHIGPEHARKASGSKVS
jgi:hypothetical protein